jgi:serine/threonine-protein kinase
MARDVAGEGNPAIGRYVIGAEIASGGMATVHLGRIVGAGGFARIVAIKRLHERYARDPEFVSMFLDEARLAARAPHPNVVSALDVVSADGEVVLVMEYVRGESVAQLARAAAGARESIPIGIAVGVIAGVLSGLHAAHEAKTERGQPLGIVHRDVSPQNVLVGVDGVARVLDFGIAKATYRLHFTKDGRLKGKLRYMAPEQLRRDDVDRRSDVYSASVVLWEMLTGRSLFASDDPGRLIEAILAANIVSPRSLRPELPEALERIVLRGLADRPEDRFPTALAMAEALEGAAVAATPREIGAWVLDKARLTLEAHAAKIGALEGSGRMNENVARARADSRFDTQPVGAATARPGLLFDDAHDEAPVPLPEPANAIPRERRRAVFGAVAILAVLALTTCAFMTSSARSTSVATSAASAEPLAPASASTSTSASTSEPVLASSLATTTSPAPPSPSTASIAGASTAQRPAVSPTRHPRAAKPARPGCDPPYFIDSDGHKQYHPKCL